MSEYHCPTCGPKWHGAFNLDHRCITCGSMIHVADEMATEDITATNASHILAAVGSIAKRQGGMTKLSIATGMSRPHLHRLLSPNGHPRLGTLLKILDVLGLRLVITRKQNGTCPDGGTCSYSKNGTICGDPICQPLEDRK